MRCLLVAMLLAIATPVRAQDRYALEATLDPIAHTVEGTLHLHFTNHSRAALSELVFHLYLNAFAGPGTVFMTESGGRMRGVDSDGEGGIEITELRVRGVDLLANADRELVPSDRTQLRVHLPEKLAANASIDLEARFVSRLPPVFARSGYSGTFHCVAQWFPKLARLEDDGTWASFPYHARGEFYADFARYELTVTTPSEYVVGATGVLESDERHGDRATRRFVADHVHDTVFVAWDHFEERNESLEGVPVRFLYAPGQLALETQIETTRDGLRRYGRRYGEYPYEALTVVLPPLGAAGAAGMEYPTLFLGGSLFFELPGARIDFGELTTAHELAHQWFQGMVASNEVQYPALDEGLTQYATLDLLEARRGRDRSLVDWPGLHLGWDAALRASTRDTDPAPMRAAPSFDAGQYGRSVYNRTALVLETIGRVWGEARLARALSRYARTERFRHPTPSDLYRAFDEVYWAGFSRDVLRPALDEGKLAEVEVELDEAGMRATRTGLPLPLTVELRARGGQRRHVVWSGADTTFVADPDVEAMIVDPFHSNLLDSDVIDNGRSRSTPPRAHGFVARALVLFDALLSSFAP